MSLTEAVTAPALMQCAAVRFISHLDRQPMVQRLKSPELPPHGGTLRWQNVLFRGGALQRGHVELFEIPGHFAVLHVCLMPHPHDPFPIMGFDMVAGHRQATGIFLDYSPVCIDISAPALRDALPATAYAQFRHPRARPDWGGIFSDDFFAIRPGSQDEIEAAIALAHDALEFYLHALALPRPALHDCARPGQLAYATAQRSNPHTFNMLSRYVGADEARRFIDDILFPLPG